MPSRIKSDRTHMDESVLAHCPELQSIPMNKPQLAAIAGGKIYRPQQAGYMFQNLPISKAQKESLLLDFVERSMKTNPITIPPRRYATRVTDKILVVPSTTPPHPTTPVQVASAAVAQTPSTLVASPQTPTFSSLFPIMRPSFSPSTYDPNMEFAAVPDVPSPPPPPPSETSGNEDEVGLLEEHYGYAQPESPEGPTEEDDASVAGTDVEEGVLVHPSRQPITPARNGLLSILSRIKRERGQTA